MANITIKLEGFDELEKKLGEIGSRQALRPALDRSLALVQERLATYPRPPDSGAIARMNLFVSDRQRRFFFAALRDGRIQVPYRRTGQLGRSWNSRVTGGLKGQVGTNRIGAPYVQGPDQAGVHQGRWETVDDVARESGPEVERIFKARIDELLG